MSVYLEFKFAIIQYAEMFQINTLSKTMLVSNADVARDVFLYFFTLNVEFMLKTSLLFHFDEIYMAAQHRRNAVILGI